MGGGGGGFTAQRESLSQSILPHLPETLPLSATPLSKSTVVVVLSGESCPLPVFQPPPDTMVTVQAPGEGGCAQAMAYVSPSGAGLKPVHSPGMVASHESEKRGSVVVAYFLCRADARAGSSASSTSRGSISLGSG